MYTSTMKQWWNDKWDGLVNPPSELHPWMFGHCIPLSIKNIDSSQAMMEATNNLANANNFARLRRGQRDLDDYQNMIEVPFPTLAPVTSQKTILVETQSIIKSIASLEKSLSESIALLKRETEAYGDRVRNAVTDNVQVARSNLVNLSETIANIAGVIKHQTKPLPILSTEPISGSSKLKDRTIITSSKSTQEPMDITPATTGRYKRVTKESMLLDD